MAHQGQQRLYLIVIHSNQHYIDTVMHGDNCKSTDDHAALNDDQIDDGSDLAARSSPEPDSDGFFKPLDLALG